MILRREEREERKEGRSGIWEPDPDAVFEVVQLVHPGSNSTMGIRIRVGGCLRGTFSTVDDHRPMQVPARSNLISRPECPPAAQVRTELILILFTCTFPDSSVDSVHPECPVPVVLSRRINATND